MASRKSSYITPRKNMDVKYLFSHIITTLGHPEAVVNSRHDAEQYIHNVKSMINTFARNKYITRKVYISSQKNVVVLEKKLEQILEKKRLASMLALMSPPKTKGGRKTRKKSHKKSKKHKTRKYKKRLTRKHKKKTNKRRFTKKRKQ